MSQLASKAEVGDKFEFSKLAAAAARCARTELGSGSSVGYEWMRRALDTLGALAEDREGEQRIFEERLELETISSLLGSVQPEDFKYLGRKRMSAGRCSLFAPSPE